MARKAYARRYARAIFEIGLAAGELDRWESDLEKLEKDLGDDATRATLENPKFALEAKVALLGERVQGLSPPASNLVRLLVTKGSLRLVPDIRKELNRLVDNQRGIEHAEVGTAVALDDNEKSELMTYLGGIARKKIVLEPEVDSKLIGGVRVRMGDKLIDGSTRGMLEALRQDLAGVRK